MEYKVESALDDFPAWSGGKDTLDVLIEKGDCEEVEFLIESSFADGEMPTDTTINDFLWFERGFIAEHLGYNDWDDYEKGISKEYRENMEQLSEELADLQARYENDEEMTEEEYREERKSLFEDYEITEEEYNEYGF